MSSDFVEIVREMREAQRNYFATRSKNWLTKAKRLESWVDGVLESSKHDPIQPNRAVEGEVIREARKEGQP
ncbi:hypothetical protein OLK001_26650 [Synechocystis sp. LKSZ1]